MPPGKRKSTAPSRYEATPPPKKVQKASKLRTRSSRGRADVEEPATLQAAEPTPAKVDDVKPLPAIETIDITKHIKLKSVAESGLLETTLHRSKSKWLTDGVLKKYWTKPSKKKGFVADPNNPARETMVRFGTCRIVVEPHIFDAVVFTIRQPGATPPNPLPPPQPRPTPYAYPPAHSQPFPQAGSQGVPRPVYQHSPPVSTGHSHSQSPQLNQPQPAAASPQPPLVKQQKPQQKPVHTSTPAASSQPKPAQDPVIQMLATRASQDPKLKELMKIVASGTANAEQLAEFQRHIDELTAILAKQREDQRKAEAALALSTPAAVPMSGLPSAGTPSRPAGQPAYPMHGAPQYHPHPPAKSKAAAADITGFCIEFAAGSGDRYLLPHHTLLDFIPERSPVIVLASFIVVRNGGLGEEGRLDPTQEYYQPVTLRIESQKPGFLTELIRGVLPPDEVYRYLQETMNKYPRAEEIRPSLQIPDEADEGESGTATPTTATDRRHSLLKAATTAGISSPAPGDGTPTRSKKGHHDPFTNNCRYCLSFVPISYARDTDGRAVCPSCKRLRDVSAAGSGIVRLSGLPIRPPAGSQALVMN
ncbi:hypothetical protein FH972_021064 [Carpinus fangiana]|uniref:SWR1-complex protein 3 domain-containing protein n=1 Tax=Carpinus fangiana TaxID=176857 RepID=A0A5N6KNU4_9ROSI|nr:hypothetical protein FH972_021064 [Carpinus fangiana]